MQPLLFKLCADSLRTFTNKNHGIKLKAAHAHELVAAFFGYSSKNAMLADIKYPITNLAQAEIIVMTSDNVVNRRRKNLQGLSSELPDSYTLGESIYEPLFSDEWWASPYPPFRDYKKLAEYLVENNEAYQAAFIFRHDIPIHHYVDVQVAEKGVLLTVIHASQTSTGEMLGNGKTTINLPRIAGRIGFSKPQISIEKWTAGARRTLESLGVQS